MKQKTSIVLLVTIAFLLIVSLIRIGMRSVADPDISPARIRQTLTQIASRPHRAGTAGNHEVGEFIIEELKKSGLGVQTDEQTVRLPRATEAQLFMVFPEPQEFDIREKALDEDAYSHVASLEFPFFAYSPDAEVEGEVVFANFGAREDYAVLKASGIDLRGKIALVRAQGICRSMKAQIAGEEHLGGLLLYPELRDQGFVKEPYPAGPHLNPWVVQRGSLLRYYEYPGDPYSDTGSEDGLPTVPAMPINPSVAEVILKHIGGPEAPASWRGWMKVPYRFGAGPAKVRLKFASRLETVKIRNILAVLGDAPSNRSSIMVATHYDAWIFGASDPGSGVAVVLEAARSLARVRKSGWTPRRNIVFAFWDAEEYGMLGSTRWVEKHLSDVRRKMAVLTYVDSVRGPYFSGYLSPGLQGLLDEVLASVNDPSGEKISDLRGQYDLPGFSSDTIPFAFAGVPIAQLNYGLHYPVYHSVYDNLNWMERFGDPGYKYSAVLARLLALYGIKLSEHPVFPYDFEEMGKAFENVLLQMEMEQGNDSPLRRKLTSLHAVVREFRRIAEKWNQAWRRSRISEEKMEHLDLVLAQALYRFTVPAPGHGFSYRNLMIGPSVENACAGAAFPSLTEALSARNEQAVEEEIERLSRVFSESALLLDQATHLLVRAAP